MNEQRQVIVVGGGLAGQWASIRIAEAGHQVQLFSLFETLRSHSVCAQGGINAALNNKGEHDSVDQHFFDTITSGCYLANQPPVKALCDAAPELIHTFERMGVAFSRTPEGLIDQRRFGGMHHRRTCFAGASTGQQLLYSVDQQVRRLEAEQQVIKYEWWEFLAIVKDSDGHCCGIVAMNLRSLEVRAFRADAVILASGGMGQLYAPKTTCSVNSTGAAASRVYQQGARIANAEFFQFHPTAMLGMDKTRLMSEAARGEGGRIWVPRQLNDRRTPTTIPESDRLYFLEEWFPRYGNNVPRDIASRAIWKVTRELELGINGDDRVYLDLTHLDSTIVESRLGSLLNIYRKFTGVDPLTTPMEIFPAAHYSMGGLWVDYEANDRGQLCLDSPRNHATNIPGLYACGECDYAYHGANRLGANSLLSTAFAGRLTGDAVSAYINGLEHSSNALNPDAYDAEVRYQNRINHHFMHANGDCSPYRIHADLGELMTNNIGVVRDNGPLDSAIGQLYELEQSFARLKLGEVTPWANQSLAYARQVFDMVKLAQVVAFSARARDECRGAHYKPAFINQLSEDRLAPHEAHELDQKHWQENNEQWLKTTIADYHPEGPRIRYDPVDTCLIKPEQPRDYR